MYNPYQNNLFQEMSGVIPNQRVMAANDSKTEDSQRQHEALLNDAGMNVLSLLNLAIGLSRNCFGLFTNLFEC